MNRPDVLRAVAHAYHAVCREGAVRRVQEPMEIWALGLDSLQILEMVTRIEESLGVRIAMEQLGDVLTVGDLCDVLESALPAPAGPPASG